MHRHFAAATILLALALPVAAQETYIIESRHTFPSFEVIHLGFSTQRGRFNRTTGKIVLDRAKQSGSIDIAIDAASIDTGLDELEKVLRGPAWLNVEKHPALTYRATRLQFKGDALAAAEGELTLLGVTRPVTLNVTRFHCGVNPVVKKPACGADLTATIKRSDFGMTASLPGVGDEVRLQIQVEALRD